ncbi:hypothetical protein KKB58_01030 [Patescibacteria group bacterium]|nr:hypothetical protein [Patescibacteria group bacterium]
MKEKKPQVTLKSFEELGNLNVVKNRINKKDYKKIGSNSPENPYEATEVKPLRKPEKDKIIKKVLSKMSEKDRKKLEEIQARTERTKRQAQNLENIRKEKGSAEKIKTARKESTERASEKLVKGIFSSKLKNKKEEKSEISPENKTIYEKKIEEVAQILKNNKIDQVIVAGEEFTDPEAKKLDPNTEEKTFLPRPDLDAYTALILLNDFNKKPPEKIYNKGAMTSLVPKSFSGKNKIEGKKGLRIFIDVGGEWIKIQKGKEITTIYVDHHGAGQKKATSGTKMMYEIMEKAGLLKEKPEWLDKFVNFVDEADNLTYLKKRNETGKKIFDKKYFKETWPKTLYSLAFSVPPKILMELFKSGKITDPSALLTEEQLNGEIGKTIIKTIKNEKGEKIKDITIAEEIKKTTGRVNKTLTNIDVINQNANRKGLQLNTKSLGKIVYHNFAETKFGRLNIPNYLAFLGTKSLGHETYVNWNKQEKSFFINSNNQNLSIIAQKLNEADPGCAKDVRGVMIFGKIKNLTEKQFLDIIDPKIAENAKTGAIDLMPKEKKGNIPEEKESNYLNPEEMMEYAEGHLGQQQRVNEIKRELREIEKKTPIEELREKQVVYEYLLKSEEYNDEPVIVKYAKEKLETIKRIEELQKELETARNEKISPSSVL